MPNICTYPVGWVERSDTQHNIPLNSLTVGYRAAQPNLQKTDFYLGTKKPALGRLKLTKVDCLGDLAQTLMWVILRYTAQAGRF